MLILTCLVGWSWQAPGLLVLAELVVVALVAAAIAGTHIDFVAVMLIAALLGVTPLPAAIPENLAITSPTSAGTGAPLTGRVLVALGDSYMSGEGAPVFFDGTDNGVSQCRQAPTVWARQETLPRPLRLDALPRLPGR
jgi:hypothetical protein